MRASGGRDVAFPLVYRSLVANINFIDNGSVLYWRDSMVSVKMEKGRGKGRLLNANGF